MKTSTQTTESARERIAIIDSHASSRIGLWRHIERMKRWDIGWASSTAEEAMEKLSKETPAAIILEIRLTGKDGLEFIKDIQPLYPGLKILVYSSQNEDFYAERCLRAGALGYLDKNKPMQLFTQALDKVLRGEIYLSSRITKNTLHSLSTHHHGRNNGDRHLHSLTDRELEIMILMAQGLSSQMSADKLKISPRTVQVHRNNIRHKIGVETALQMHAYAVRFYGDNAESQTPTDDGREAAGQEPPLLRSTPLQTPPTRSQKKTSLITPRKKGGKPSASPLTSLKKTR